MKKAVTKKKARVVIEGEMNIYRALELKEKLLDGLEKSKVLELDLSGVEEIDTSGFQLLFMAWLEAAKREKKMEIAARSRAVTAIMELYNMESFFHPAGEGGKDAPPGEAIYGK